MIWRTRLALAIAACMTGAGAVHAKVVIHSTSKDLKSGREADHQTYYVENGLVRMDTKMDKSAMQQAGQQMEQELAKMPPEQRAMVEKMMGGAGKPPAASPSQEGTWTDTGQTETVGKYTCHLCESRFNGQLETQFCVVPTAILPGGDELVSAMRRVGKIARDLASAMPAAERLPRPAFLGRSGPEPPAERQSSTSRARSASDSSAPCILELPGAQLHQSRAQRRGRSGPRSSNSNRTIGPTTSR
jgi:hypothetical protein